MNLSCYLGDTIQTLITLIIKNHMHTVQKGTAPLLTVAGTLVLFLISMFTFCLIPSPDSRESIAPH